MADGYTLDHYDDINPDQWNKDGAGNPQGNRITTLIDDPDYVDLATDPSRAEAPIYSTVAAAVDATCTDVPPAYATLPGMTCYKPGVYAFHNPVFTVGSGSSAYLEPGMYFFDWGAQVSGSIYGGLLY